MTRRRPGERGMTLIELMTTMAVSFIAISGMFLFLIAQAKLGRDALDRTDIQRGGRAALSIMEREIGAAGLGLPRELAIKSFDTPVKTKFSCAAWPELTVAALDFRREWSVSGVAPGSITLGAAIPVPDPPGDTKLLKNSWVFLYRSVAPGGYGATKLAAERAAGAATLSAAAANYYSDAQKALDMSATSPLSGPGEMLALRLSTFGVNCDNATHQYLYWLKDVVDDSGTPLPIARNVTKLEFRLHLDTDGDVIGDKVVNLAGTPAPTSTEMQTLVAVEARLTVRSEDKDPKTNDWREETFAMVIRTPNINTAKVNGEFLPYVFLKNSALGVLGP